MIDISKCNLSKVNILLSKLTFIIMNLLIYIYAVKDLYNAILYIIMIHITQMFLNISNAFYNYRNIDTSLKKKRSSEFKIG